MPDYGYQKHGAPEPSAPPDPNSATRSGSAYPVQQETVMSQGSPPPPYTPYPPVSVHHNNPPHPSYPLNPGPPPPIGFVTPTPPPGTYVVQPGSTVVFPAGPTISVQTQQPVPKPRFGTSSTVAYCATCGRNVHTRLIYNTGSCTWLACCCLAIFGCFCGCCLIPFCCDSTKDIQHDCKSCGRTVGVYRRL